MKRFFLLTVLSACASLFHALEASAQAKMEMVKVAEGVYTMVHPQGSSNSTFVITDEGVVVLDADIRTAGQTLAAIRRLTDKKVRYFITSHAAGDHSSGVWYFREDRPVYIATKNQLRDSYMQEAREFEERQASNDARFAAYKGKEPVRPDIGFEGSLTLHFGGLTFQLTGEGYGHSTGDLTVYIPQRRVMLMGDLLNTDVHPGQGESGMVFFSQPAQWISILDRIMQRNLPVDTYVPWHGRVNVGAGVKDLEDQKRYFILMRDAVAKMIAAGKTLEQIQKEFKPPQELAHYRVPERLRSFLRLYYAQLVEKGIQ